MEPVSSYYLVTPDSPPDDVLPGLPLSKLDEYSNLDAMMKLKKLPAFTKGIALVPLEAWVKMQPKETTVFKTEKDVCALCRDLHDDCTCSLFASETHLSESDRVVGVMRKISNLLDDDEFASLYKKMAVRLGAKSL